jgi:hypothetical protein
MPADLPKAEDWRRKMLAISSEQDRQALMMQAFDIQFTHNRIYQRFCTLLKKTPSEVSSVSDIPYLPISFFKSGEVITGTWKPHDYFQSSGTTGENSRHYYPELSLYEASFINGFTHFYGEISNYCILALLPSYIEQGRSSLVYLADRLMQISGHPQNGFYLNNYQELASVLQQLEKQQQPTLLIGVTYALLDFAAAHPMPLRSTMIMETGGMKGRKKEMIREEVHGLLKNAFHLQQIHSEYGMTELFSQAYAKVDGRFSTPPWMKVSVREEDDPMGNDHVSGLIHVADLANIHSCCFIATADRGRMHEDGSFEVLGRLDHADVRGCSLMYSGT